MPRTIDSLSPKSDGAQSKPSSGDTYRPAGSSPVAGETVRPSGSESNKPVAAKQLRSNSFQVVKKESSQRKREARRPFVKAFLKIGLPIIIILLVVGGYLVTTRRSITLNGQKKDNLTDASTKKKAEEAYNGLPLIGSLNDDDKTALRKELGPNYLAAYVTGVAPSQADLNRLQLSYGGTATKDQIEKAINGMIDYKLDLVKNDGYYEGFAFYFWYGSSIVNKLPEETIAGWGDPSVLATDKAYADSKAKEYREQLSSGKITNQALISALEADNKLQLYDEANGSSSITSTKVDSTSDDDGRSASLLEFLKQQNSLGISQIGTLSADPGYPSSGRKKDVAYVFVNLTKLLRGQAVIDYYNQQLLVAKGL